MASFSITHLFAAGALSLGLAPLVGCASTSGPRWISGICGQSASLDGSVASKIDVTPQQSGGSLYNLELYVDPKPGGRQGFGCDLIPSSVRGSFTADGLSANAVSSVTKDGFKIVSDKTVEYGKGKERKLSLEKKGANPFYVNYRWDDTKAFLNRAYWHTGKGVTRSKVMDFLASWRDGWADYKPWSTIGIGECAARFAFPRPPECTFIVGSDNVVTRCVAKAPDKDGALHVAECMVQGANTEANEAATLTALDRGLGLAQFRVLGGTRTFTKKLSESARRSLPDAWLRTRRHTLRSEDGRLNREALVAAKEATIYAVWVEWDSQVTEKPTTIERFFKGFQPPVPSAQGR